MSVLKRYTQLPTHLVHIFRLPVPLRVFNPVKRSWDLKLHDGKVLPMKADKYVEPNGMSMRPPKSEKMRHTVSTW